MIIDGNGFTVNMAGAAFNVGASSTVRGSIFTITNINLIHWQSGTNSGDSGTGTADAVIDSRSATGGYGYWYFNIDNVSKDEMVLVEQILLINHDDYWMLRIVK